MVGSSQTRPQCLHTLTLQLWRGTCNHLAETVEDLIDSPLLLHIEMFGLVVMQQFHPEDRLCFAEIFHLKLGQQSSLCWFKELLVRQDDTVITWQ